MSAPWLPISLSFSGLVWALTLITCGWLPHSSWIWFYRCLSALIFQFYFDLSAYLVNAVSYTRWRSVSFITSVLLKVEMVTAESVTIWTRYPCMSTWASDNYLSLFLAMMSACSRAYSSAVLALTLGVFWLDLLFLISWPNSQYSTIW